MSRPPYEELPPHVRAAVDAALGWPVVRAASEHGGWSPGVAARVWGPSGQAAFVKAVSGAVNAHSAALHRREAAVTPALRGVAPALLGVHDDGTWVALVLEQVPGRPPAQPWVPAELDAVLRAVERVAEHPAPPGVPDAVDALDGDLGGWAVLAERGGATGREGRALDRLVALEAGFAEASAGDGLLHLDVRDDNAVLRPDGEAVLVDWPWAARGAAVLDLVALAPSAALRGGPPPEELLARTRAGRDADPDALRAVVAAFAGCFVERSLQPAPPGLPGLRAFQAAQGEVAVPWLRRLLGTK